jgi:hypothetical protein
LATQSDPIVLSYTARVEVMRPMRKKTLFAAQLSARSAGDEVVAQQAQCTYCYL